MPLLTGHLARSKSARKGANMYTFVGRCSSVVLTGRQQIVRLLLSLHGFGGVPVPNLPCRIPQRLFLTIRGGRRVHCYEGWRNRPLPWLRVSYVQGSQNGQHCHRERALSGWQNCKWSMRHMTLPPPNGVHLIDSNLFFFSLPLSRLILNELSPATNKRRHPRSLLAVSARIRQTTSSKSTLRSSAVLSMLLL